MAHRARRFVEERTWERAGDQVEAALLDYLGRPRRSGEAVGAQAGGKTAVDD